MKSSNINSNNSSNHINIHQNNNNNNIYDNEHYANSMNISDRSSFSDNEIDESDGSGGGDSSEDSILSFNGSDSHSNLPINLSKSITLNTIFIGNLPKDMSTYNLGALLKNFNPIQFHLKKNYNGKSEGYGFAKFNTKDEAIRAMLEINKTKYENRELKSSWASENSTIFVYNIDIYKPKEELFKLFRKYGEFNEAECYFKLNYALIKFFKRNDAQNAISKLQGKIFGSKPLSINWGDSIVLRTSVYIVFDNTKVNSIKQEEEKSFHRKIFDIAHRFGKTNHYHIPRKDDGSYEGFGFIHFRYSKNGEKAAENMISYFTKNNVDGVTINCSFAKKKRTKKLSSGESSPTLVSSPPPNVVPNYPQQSQYNTFFTNTSPKLYNSSPSIDLSNQNTFDNRFYHQTHSPQSNQQQINNPPQLGTNSQQQLNQQSNQLSNQQQSNQQLSNQQQLNQQQQQYLQFQYGYRNLYPSTGIYQQQQPQSPPQQPQYNYIPYQNHYQSQDFQTPITYSQPYQTFSNFPSQQFPSFVNFSSSIQPPPQQQKPYQQPNTQYLKQPQTISPNTQSFKIKSPQQQPQHIDEMDSFYPSSSSNTPPFNNSVNIFSPSIYPYHINTQPQYTINNTNINNNNNNIKHNNNNKS